MMKSVTTNLPEFYVHGLQIRTTNAKEMSAAGKIPALWNQFYAEQVPSKILEKLEDSIYAVYSDYQSDVNGEYSLTIGLKVRPGGFPLPGLKMVRISAQNYMKYTTEVGAMPTIVVDGWKHIWNQMQTSQLQRKYAADFEVYDHRCADPQKSQADIYIYI